MIHKLMNALSTLIVGGLVAIVLLVAFDVQAAEGDGEVPFDRSVPAAFTTLFHDGVQHLCWVALDSESSTVGNCAPATELIELLLEDAKAHREAYPPGDKT